MTEPTRAPRGNDLTRPDVDPHLGDPPADLLVTDEVVGDGPEATAGSTVSTHYVGVAHSTGEEFDASWNRGTPLDFRVGVGQVIPGWDQGITGMRVGGRRRLVIPPHLGYGARGAGSAIGPDETLIFVVDLAATRAGHPRRALHPAPARPAPISTVPAITA